MLRILRTAILAVAGGFVADLAGAPLPWLFGALITVAVSGMAGYPAVDLPRWGKTATRAVVGILIGSSVQLDLFGRLAEFAWSAALVPVQVALVTLCCGWFLRRVMGLSPGEALLGGLPGGLFTVVFAIQGEGGDERRVALLHTIRVALVVTAVPFVLFWETGAIQQALPPQDPVAVTAQSVGFLVVVAALGLGAARFLRFPGADVMAPMLLTAGARLSGWDVPPPPGELTILVQLALGTSVGVGFRRGIDGFGRLAIGGVGIALIGMAAMAVSAWALHVAFGVSREAGLLAFAPGGVAEMSIAAFALGVDPGYVGAIHIWRLFFVFAALPYLLARLKRESASSSPTPPEERR